MRLEGELGMAQQGIWKSTAAYLASVATSAGAAWFMIAATLSVNMLLVYDNNQLKHRLSQPSNMTAGSRVTDLTGFGLDGRREHLAFESDRRFVVFTFSVTCPFCQASLGEWKAIERRLDPAKWSVVWVSRDSLERTREFARTEAITGHVLVDVPHRLYAQLGLGSVPKTVVLSDRGEVTGSVGGAVNASRAASIAQLLNGAPARLR